MDLTSYLAGGFDLLGERCGDLMVCLARGVLVDHRCTCAVVTHPGLQVGEAGPRLCRRLWDNEVLMGWYAANDGSIRSKGTMYFVLHPHGLNMSGRWTGLGYDGRGS
jgi:hypothetical protein